MADSSTIPIIAQALTHQDRTAVIADEGRFTYGDLLGQSARAAANLLDGQPDLNQARVAFLMPPGMSYVVAQWAVWRAGAIAVPLCTQHPEPEIAYVIDDADVSIVIAHPSYESLLRPIAQERGLRLIITTDLTRSDPVALPDVTPDRAAMLVYTSGTTSKPKGTVVTHNNIAAQVISLVEAWGWTREDHILEVLPLHHVHGIVNVLCCALWSGATCEIMSRFDVDRVWQRMTDGDGLTLFMAVPTIYARLTQTWEQAGPDEQRAMTAGCAKLRLMVCGSAALPVPTLEKWRTIAGHTLLERYGMTEIGMALSNPLGGERKPGCVGKPLPGMMVRLVDEQNCESPDGQPGQIQVKGPNVFAEYWNKPQATQASFTDDGWFKTGDVAVRKEGIYRILGRESVDIIKTGGFKVSALEIEDKLRAHDAIAQVAIVGIEDREWGQRVAAAVVLHDGSELTLDALRQWAKQQMAVYKVPSLLHIVDALPQNVLGKVTKPKIIELFAQTAAPKAT